MLIYKRGCTVHDSSTSHHGAFQASRDVGHDTGHPTWFTTRHNVGHGAPDTDTQLRLVEPVELRCVGSCGASQHLNRPSECLAAQLCGQTNEPEPGSFWIRGGIRLNLHRFVDP